KRGERLFQGLLNEILGLVAVSLEPHRQPEQAVQMGKRLGLERCPHAFAVLPSWIGCHSTKNCLRAAAPSFSVHIRNQRIYSIAGAVEAAVRCQARAWARVRILLPRRSQHARNLWWRSPSLPAGHLAPTSTSHGHHDRQPSAVDDRSYVGCLIGGGREYGPPQ